jgi:hypothetical protein
MSLFRITASFVAMFTNKGIITSTSSEYIFDLSVEKARKYQTALAEFFVQAAEGIDVDLAMHIEELGIFDHVSEVSNR